MWIDGPTASLGLTLEEPPLWVAVDPEGAAIVDWDRTQNEQEWVSQLKHSKHYRAKIHAMVALGELKATDDAVAALSETLSDQARHPKYRIYAARSLGKLASVDATDALLKAMNDADGYIREAAARALGAGLGPDKVQAALKQAQGTDKVRWVRTAALEALADLNPQEAASLARARLRKSDKSFEGAEHRSALYTLGRVGKEGDLTLLIPFLDAKHKEGVRSAAAMSHSGTVS